MIIGYYESVAPVKVIPKSLSDGAQPKKPPAIVSIFPASQV
jgi:hypothetical protein